MELFWDNKTNILIKLDILVTRLKWPHVREFGFRNAGNVGLWNPESGKILLLEYKKNLESWVLECGVQLKESGIPLMIGIQNPSYNDKYRNPVPAILVKNLETLVCVSPSQTSKQLGKRKFCLTY